MEYKSTDFKNKFQKSFKLWPQKRIAEINDDQCKKISMGFMTSLLILLISSGAWGNPLKLAEILFKAHSKGQLLPVISITHPEIDIDMAYAIQTAYVKKRLATDKLAGFKAGLTSQSIQKKFGVNAPLAGVLFDSGKNTNNAIIDQSNFNKLMIETEIGFTIKRPIHRQLKDISELRSNIESVMPVIELPELGFSDIKKIKGVDIVAANITSTEFIIGHKVNPEKLNLNTVSVNLYLNGEKINTGKGSDALGDQWKTALWLINTMIKQGWSIEPGHIIITGALGKMIPGKAGKYVANYENFGNIFFEVK